MPTTVGTIFIFFITQGLETILRYNILINIGAVLVYLGINVV
jgi:hypothetical protein